MSDPAISFDGVGKRFDETWVLRDIDLAVDPGTIIGLIGPSGSGKTTIVRLANGFYAADAGSVRLLDWDPATMPTAARQSIGYLPQHAVLFDDLSLWENLNFHASLNGVGFKRRERLHELLDLVDLAGEEHKLVSEASGGMRRRLALAATLVHSPPVLMLDEPTAGIDPILRRRFWEHFRRLRDEGTTLVISTQYVTEAADCDVVAMLAHGRTAAVGSPDELRRQAYGGREFDVRFARPIDADVVAQVLAIDGVHRAAAREAEVVRLALDPAVVDVGAIEANLSGAPDVVATTEVAADWDDVFIELVGSDASDDVTTPGSDDDVDDGDEERPNGGPGERDDDGTTDDAAAIETASGAPS